MRYILSAFLFLSVILAYSGEAHAQASTAKGNWYFGINFGLTTAEQEHINTLQQRANIREGGISAGTLKNAYEGSIEMGGRIKKSMFGIVVRPGYFYQKEAGGSHEYSVTGWNLFPLFRLYPLENSFMKFYLHVGLGYGASTGKIKENDAVAEFKGSAFGTLIGLGTEFALTKRHHLGLEGNYRHLNFERNIATSATGTFASNSLTQAENNKEIEFDQQDLATSMTGLQFMARYIFYF